LKFITATFRIPSMTDLRHDTHPYHAHIYFDAHTREQALALRGLLSECLASRSIPALRLVGRLREGSAGPHPIPQFEVHFLASALPAVREAIHASGLTALLHPLTDDDVADHTSLAEWIGAPLSLDLTTLDPPGHNRGVARFGVSDF
jgi:aromatic ring-cleaving dioxygenase